MSEYWKSTPKYWCKYCKTYVRDTPIERNNHEQTPKHQGGVKRFLKDLHRTNEREARDADRAKAEAARLNGAGPGHSVAGPAGLKSTSGGGGGGSQAKATEADRKRQLAQLAALGVAVPDEYRRENAMAGEWESAGAQPRMPLGPAQRKPLGEKVKKEEDVKVEEDAGDTEQREDEEDTTLEAGPSSVRKRALDEDDELEGLRFKTKKRPNWGTDVKAFRRDDDDLDALLESTDFRKREPRVESRQSQEEATPQAQADKEGSIKTVEGTETVADIPSFEDTKSVEVEVEENNDDDLDVGAIFKKRKPKLKK